MSITVEMTYYVCRHCGVPWGVPKVLAEAKGSVNLPCPNGHTHYRADTTQQRIDQKDEQIADQRAEIKGLERTIASLKGQVTRLKRRAARDEGGK